MPVSTPCTKFQSRSGFSPCFDRFPVRIWPDFESVSIPVWVFSLLRRFMEYPNGVRHISVSIPVWVFSLLRRPLRRLSGTFPNVSIPVWVFSLLRPYHFHTLFLMLPSFNPGLGFLPASTRLFSRIASRASQFQSRSGFSPCFDRG